MLANVLHAMGYDAFGLPAEQYAVQTGQHPRVTTEANIANMSRQHGTRAELIALMIFLSVIAFFSLSLTVLLS